MNSYNARELAAQIERDIAIGQFDPTLIKYKPKPPEPEPVKRSTVELFEQFIEHRRQSGTSGQAISSKYNALLANLRRFDLSIESEADARKFVDLLRSRQSPLIANQNLSLLKSFADWAVAEQKMESNWFKSIRKLKEPKTVSPKRRPFTRAEVNLLLTTAKTHPKFYQWHDFCMVLLYLGLRPSEAIGLRWSDVDLTRGEVTIASALARDEDGRSAGTSRVRKSTKAETVRTLDIPPSLLAMLKGKAATVVKPDDLIFTTTRSRPIDDHSFSQRVWKQLCAAADIPYRVPYASRHTVLTHGLESGAMTRTQAQYAAGHSDSRSIDAYIHMLQRPKLIDWQQDL